MYNKVQSDHLFLNTDIGVKRVFQYLNKDNTVGLTQEEMANFQGISGNDMTFLQILGQGFNEYSGEDKILSQEELSTMLSKIQSGGYTYEQLAMIQSQMQTSTGENKSLLETVINHFKEIDKNGDGKVTKEEIDTFMIEKEIKDKKEDLTAFNASKYTVFYAETPISQKEDDE